MSVLVLLLSAFPKNWIWSPQIFHPTFLNVVFRTDRISPISRDANSICHGKLNGRWNFKTSMPWSLQLMSLANVLVPANSPPHSPAHYPANNPSHSPALLPMSLFPLSYQYYCNYYDKLYLDFALVWARFHEFRFRASVTIPAKACPIRLACSCTVCWTTFVAAS